MTTKAHKLRPFLPSDTAGLRELFAQSIETLAADSYDDDERAAWIATADDADVFGVRLAAGVTLIVGVDGLYQGFATLSDDNTVFDMLYVHPAAAGTGVATTLADAVERIATARLAKTLTVDASDNALQFFEQRGYVPFQRSTRIVNGVWLSNTTLKKQLAPANAKVTS